MIRFCLDWIGYWMVRLIGSVVQRLSLEKAIHLGRRAGGLVYLLSGRRQLAYANLKAAFPESTAQERKRWTKEMFENLGMSGVEILRFPILRKEDVDRCLINHGYEIYLEHRQRKKGLILLTAHMGNWELPQIVEGLRGRPLIVLARRQKYKRLDELLNSFREYYGSVSVGKGGGIRDLIRGLRQGGCVGVLGDQAGRDDGVWVRFFGRLTLSPRGPMALALKLGVPVLPVFFVRRHGPYHDLFIEPPFNRVETGERDKDIEANTQNYIRLLESYLLRYPSQWLWGHKRWKRTRTKRMTILSDGKRGHVKQSEALVKEFLAKGSEATPPYEMFVEKIEVQFRSAWRKKLFPCFAFFFIPWAQGRLRWLRAFLSPESADRLERCRSDLVVSAGASLVPLNLCLVRENLAKSVVLMKPGFPFNLFRYDLALIPAHDRGLLPRGSYRLRGSLSGIDAETLEVSKRLLARSIKNPERVRLSLFLGGETRRFQISLSKVEELLSELERASERLGGDFLVTASRRTPEAVNQLLLDRLSRHPRCQLCVIPSQDGRPEVVPGMMALADFLIVTEDSLSMISEALSSGKTVVVVKMGRNGLPKKHDRFQTLLCKEWGVPVVETERLSEALEKGNMQDFRERFEQERMKIREKLESLL